MKAYYQPPAVQTQPQPSKIYTDYNPNSQSQLNMLTEQLRQRDSQIYDLKNQNLQLQYELEKARKEISLLRDMQLHNHQQHTNNNSRYQAASAADGQFRQLSSAPFQAMPAATQNTTSRAKQEQMDAILAQSLLNEEIMERDSQLARTLQMEEGGFGNQVFHAQQRRVRANSVDEYQANLELQEDLGSVQVGLSTEQIQRLGYTLMPKAAPYGPFVK